MEYVTLGRTGMKISRLGFGGIPIQRIDAPAAKELLVLMSLAMASRSLAMVLVARMNSSRCPSMAWPMSSSLTV